MKITKSQLKQIIKEELEVLKKAREGRECDKSYKQIERDAWDLYDALKGLDIFSTGEKDAIRVMNTYYYTDCITKLYSAFDRILEYKDDLGDGDLADWLKSDGLDNEAFTVRSVVPKIRG